MSAECSAGNIPSGYKQTEVGVIPGDWNVKKLEEVVDIDADNLSAGTPVDYAFNYISLEDVDEGVLRSYSSQIFGSAPSRARRRLRYGDVLVSTVRPNLKSHLLFKQRQGEWICSTGFSVVRCKNSSAVPSYIFAHLFATTIPKQIESLLTGSNYPAINGKDVKALLIPLPPTLAEQKSIAEALSDTDAFIESLEQLIAKKRQIKQGAMQELLIGKRRLPGFEIKLGYKQTEVGVIPEDWEITKIIEKANIIDSLHQTPSFSGDGFPMVRVSDIKPGNLDLSKTLKVCETVFVEFTRNYKPKRGDIVLSRVGSYGVSSFVETEELFCMGQNTVVIEPRVPARLLYYILNSPIIRQQVEDNSFGTGYKSLSLKSIKELKIAIPSTKDEQEAIASILSDMDAEIAALEEKLAKAHHLKHGMMQELLTGRIRLI